MRTLFQMSEPSALFILANRRRVDMHLHTDDRDSLKLTICCCDRNHVYDYYYVSFLFIYSVKSDDAWVDLLLPP